jgi:hypothetical protein
MTATHIRKIKNYKFTEPECADSYAPLLPSGGRQLSHHPKGSENILFKKTISFKTNNGNSRDQQDSRRETAHNNNGVSPSPILMH